MTKALVYACTRGNRLDLYIITLYISALYISTPHVSLHMHHSIYITLYISLYMYPFTPFSYLVNLLKSSFKALLPAPMT